MKVNVFDILDKGKTLAFKGDEPFIREIIARLTADDPDPARAAKNAHLTAKVVLTREGKTVFLEGEAAAEFSAPCARCLKPVETHLAPSFFVTLFPDKDDSGGEEVQLKNDELDENTYIGEEVDVGLVLNEQILLERPYLILCSEDCKGLCPRCGTELNDAPCDCPPVVDSQWDALRKLDRSSK